MKISFKVSDYNPYSHLLEAGVDGFEIYEDSSVSILNNWKSKNVIYPNPAENWINISLDGLKSIFNISGELIIKCDKKNIDVSKLKSGIYFLNLNDQFYKFIKT